MSTERGGAGWALFAPNATVGETIGGLARRLAGQRDAWSTLTVAADWPVETPLTLNRATSTHWSVKGGQAAAWRDTGRLVVARSLHALNSGVRGLPLAEIGYQFVYPGGRLPDPDNLAACTKPLLDGMVDAGCWPDDTASIVRNGGVRVVSSLVHGRQVLVRVRRLTHAEACSTGVWEAGAA